MKIISFLIISIYLSNCEVEFFPKKLNVLMFLNEEVGKFYHKGLQIGRILASLIAF